MKGPDGKDSWKIKESICECVPVTLLEFYYFICLVTILLHLALADCRHFCFFIFLKLFLQKSNVKYLSLSVSSLGLGEYEEDDGQEEDEDQGEGEEGPGEAERGLQVGVELERGHQQDAGPGPRQALETRGNF